jgi:hypothetical protein
MNATTSQVITPQVLKGCGVLQQRSAAFDLCFWLCPYGKDEVVFEGFAKVKSGVKHLVNRYERVTVLDAFSDTLQHGFLSPRPYRLGQACDGSINDCALALFVRFCRDEGHSPDSLYRMAYTDERENPGWSEAMRAAEWQGVVYPKRWNAKAKAGLLESLHEINFHSLASVVSDLVEGGAK